jgi:FkbM family methyltransferase
MTDGGSESEASANFAQLLRHPEPVELWFQLAEIVGRRTYLRHGVQVREGDVVLDVGANVGVAAAYFASECRAGLVHSFEPVEPLFRLLEGNLRAFPACVAHGYGLSSAPGEARITYYPGATAMSSLYADTDEGRNRVRTFLLNRGVPEDRARERLAALDDSVNLSCELRTLSSVLAEEAIKRVDLLKIDVEKAELDVLDGIDDDDWACIGQIVAEVHDEHGRLARISSRLAERGFSVTTEQDAVWAGTPMHMLYATRG